MERIVLDTADGVDHQWRFPASRIAAKRTLPQSGCCWPNYRPRTTANILPEGQRARQLFAPPSPERGERRSTLNRRQNDVPGCRLYSPRQIHRTALLRHYPDVPPVPSRVERVDFD